MSYFNSVAAWLQNEAYTGDKPLAELQLQQTKARILLTIASLTYVILHGEYFQFYKVEALIYTGFYFIMNAAALISLRKQPFTILGSLFYPLLDVIIVAFGMLIDGGHASGIYFILPIIIIGNGLRFGNPMLIYSQILCLIGLFGSTAYGHYSLQLPIDYTLLFWQVFTLLAVPFYVYLIVKKVETAIYERNAAEQSSFQLIDKGPLPVFTFELDAGQNPQMLYANAAMFQLFHNKQSDIVGKPAEILVLPEDAEEMNKFCRAALFDGTSKNLIRPKTSYLRGIDASDRIIKLMASAIRMRWHENWIGVCFLLDITERETLQEELEAVYKEGYMSTLVAGIVHDFRNVLTNMIGNAEVLQMNSNDAAEKQQIESIIEAGERGSELVTHLLKLSRKSDPDQTSVCTAGIELQQPLDNIIGLARLQLPHNIRLICHIDAQLPDVAINVIEIEQILLNLINNSRQAITGTGRIEVNIGTASNKESGLSELCINVTDNGEGISKEDLDKVFKPFWTSRKNIGGTGIGLTMVQRIVKLHHGRIDISSPAGEHRTTVTVCIPSFQTEEKTKSGQSSYVNRIEEQSAGDHVVVQPQHVLLVDDMLDILHIHKAMLARMGHSAAMAESADQAMQLFNDEQQQFDLIITDFRMPGKDGLQMVKEIRQKDPTIPILMITAYGEDEQLQQAASYGVHLISKPVSINKMETGIRLALTQTPNQGH
ncbi:PAS domain S-box-containing protein [Mariprofundus ferrinatatus]|uniref:histidine kinase n=1 Tax=Mariprofundus ferrinatatus TaxID=1921087 RepID=A0A2K8L7E0_9PROT|nr:response regulator [Mariprofundus ferrinatatus]ATX82169.1 PAS domain S-box-containing protein [Mariprofundus ferrinatatus]